MTTQTDDRISTVANAITYASELLTRLDNGDSLRQWEILEGRGIVEEADSNLDAIQECDAVHCDFPGSDIAEKLRHIAKRYDDTDCTYVMNTLLEDLTDAQGALQDRDVQANEQLAQWRADTDKIASLEAALDTHQCNGTADHTACIARDEYEAAMTRGAELETENAALRQMVELLKERSDFLVKALNSPRRR